MKSIPEEIYEASDIDGASIWVKLRHVTFPYLKPLLIINFIGVVVGSFHSMGNILALTAGGPQFATNVLPMEIWRSAFLYLKFGYATAVSWILGFMLMGFMIYQLKTLQRFEFKSADKIDEN